MSRMLAAASGALALVGAAPAAQAQSPVPPGKYEVSWFCRGEPMGGSMEVAADGSGLFSYVGMGAGGQFTSGAYSVRLTQDGPDVRIQPQAWVDRRPGATMYPGRVRVQGDRMNGAVEAPGCSTLMISRTDGGRIAAPEPRVTSTAGFPGPPPLSLAGAPAMAADACRSRYTARGRTWAQVVEGLDGWSRRPELFDSYVKVMQVAFAEQRYRDVLACRDTIRADTGQDLVDAARLEGWNRDLQTAALTFFARHRSLIEQDLSGGDPDSAFASTVAGSRALSPLGRQALAAGKARRDARLAAEAATKAEAERAAAEKRAALAALAPAFGPWRKTDTYEYTRAAPGGVTAKLFCDTAGGLGVALNIADGYFVAPQDVRHTNATDLVLTSRAGPRRFKAVLGYSGSSTSTGYEYGREVKVNTTYYDPRRASFAMNVPARRGAAAQALLEGTAQAGTRFAEALGAGRPADEDNPLLLLMRMTGQLTAAGLQANTLNFADIASVRNEPSLRLSVAVAGRGLTDLFDLEPTKAPFATLLKACS